jgi:SWI/SNF-related matrix-associated actin-dependent regulator of chromatin subfamily B protein 1
LDLPECFYLPIAESVRLQVEQAKLILPWWKAVSNEALYPIHIKLRINDTILIDKFEWDLSNSQNDPDHFARTFCAEMV